MPVRHVAGCIGCHNEFQALVCDALSITERIVATIFNIRSAAWTAYAFLPTSSRSERCLDHYDVFDSAAGEQIEPEVVYSLEDPLVSHRVR